MGWIGRVIYRIDDAVRVVSVAHVGHRADVYRVTALNAAVGS